MAHDHNQVCICVVDHRPKIDELDRHHVIPLSWGGPDIPSNLTWLCPNAHRQVHLLLSYYMRQKGIVEWEVLAQFSIFTRKLAKRGWDGYQATQSVPT